MGLFPIFCDFIMAVNYLMTALSLYKIFYDKSIKIVFSLIYLLYFAYEVWWLSESLILLKMSNCSSDIATIEATNPYQRE